MRFCDHRPATGQLTQSDKYESIKQRLFYFILEYRHTALRKINVDFI